MTQLPPIFLRATLFFALLFVVNCAGGNTTNAPPADVGPVVDLTTADKVVGQPGYFRVAQIDGVWWFIDPDDHKFFSKGVNHIEAHYVIYSDKFRTRALERWGSDLELSDHSTNIEGEAAQKFMNEHLDIVQSWGFNSLGHQNSIPQTRLPYVANFRPAELDGWPGVKKEYYDPFSKQTAGLIGSRAKEWAADKHDDPLIMGVAMTSIPLWNVRKERIHGWVRAIMGLGANEPGKRKWVEVLKGHYNSPEEAAVVYGVTATSWDDLAAETRWPRVTDRDAVLLDQRVFLPQIAEAWYKMLHAVMRRTMPNHLIFGDKFVPFKSVPDWMPPILRDNVDVLFLMWFEETDAQTARLRELYLETGLPVVMGDTSYAMPNEAVPNPKGVRRDSQDEVGKAYAEYLTTMAREPFFIGWHHCGVIEGAPELEQFSVLLSRQNGLMLGDGTVYEDAVKHIKKANSQAFSLHEKAVVSVPPTCETTDKGDYRLSKVGERVWELRPGQGAGPLATPISWIIGDNAVAVYDTGTVEAATLAVELIREQTTLPIKYIVYSHHHGTQLMGAEVLKAANEGEIIAYEGLIGELDLMDGLDAYYQRSASLQFDEPMGELPRFVYPDKTFSTTMTLDLGGVELELLHVDGEASDYAVLWWPAGKVVWLSDMLPRGMPMVASPMEPVRSEDSWRRSLQKIKDLGALVTLSTSNVPGCDPLAVNNQINDQMMFFDYLHMAMMREMNVGSTEDEAVANVRLPPALRDSPYLSEGYGTLEFAVRGLHHRYSGWFDQNGSDAAPVNPGRRAADFITLMGGRDILLRQAGMLLEIGDPTLALAYLDLLIDSDASDGDAHQYKARALSVLAESPDVDSEILKNVLRRSSAMHSAKGVVER